MMAAVSTVRRRIAMLDLLKAQLPLWSDQDPSHGFHVRESRRARRLAVRVLHSGRVEVVVPLSTSHHAVEHFLARHRAWIERKRAEARRHGAAADVFPPERIELAGCGELWRLHLAGGRGRLRVLAAGGLLSVQGEPHGTRELKQALRQWLLRHAHSVLARQLHDCAHELGFRYERVIVRRQRTRWGSCSVHGTISLNCCLLFQRREVLRYLLVHELAHTRHMNHSRRFWDCVQQHCADHRALDRELLDGWRRVPGWVFSDG
jgi:predicted metal-dependent hydrolase